MVDASAALVEVQRAWPALQIDAEQFAAALRQLQSDGELDPDDPEQLSTLGLAVACAQGDRAALDAFERKYFGPVAAIANRVIGRSASVDELLQRLRERLFVPPASGQPPRILAVAGRGDMQSLVRVSATRLALNLRRGDARGQRRREHLARDGSIDDVLDDPELALLKTLDRAIVKEALAAALSALEAGQRNLLRHHLVDHLSIDQIAQIYGIHRATAARRLNRARADAASATREFILARVGPEVQQAALRQFVDSRLDLSLSRLLATAPPPEAGSAV